MADNNPMQNPFEDVFRQIADILKFVEENASKPADDSIIPSGIADKLAKLRANVDKFKEMGDNFVNEWNIQKLQLKGKLPLGELTVSKEEKQLMDKANKLKNQLESASKKFSEEASQASQQNAASLPPETDLKYGKKRRKKFKRFGSSNKWKPL